MPNTTYSLTGDTCDIYLHFYSGEFFDYENEDGTTTEMERLDSYSLADIPIPENLE